MPSAAHRSGLIKQAIAKTIGLFGYQLVRLPSQATMPAILYDDVYDALMASFYGGMKSFKCPVVDIVDKKGFGLSSQSWHPFVETAKEILNGAVDPNETTLAAFYEVHQPRYASEAIPGFRNSPPCFQSAPPHAYYAAPWGDQTPEIAATACSNWVLRDNAEHGADGLSIQEGGFPMHGPVAPSKLELEFTRLRNVVASIKSEGYDRTHGDVNFTVLKRGERHRFICDGGGFHRAAAMAALGATWIPGQFFPSPMIVDLELAHYWRLVRTEIWPVENARRYFEHLFDFDARQWASALGLTDPEAITISR